MESDARVSEAINAAVAYRTALQTVAINRILYKLSSPVTGWANNPNCRKLFVTSRLSKGVSNIKRFSSLSGVRRVFRMFQKVAFINNLVQGRSQEFAKGERNQEVWGTEVPQRGLGAAPRWGSGGQASRSRRQMWIRKTNKPPI